MTSLDRQAYYRKTGISARQQARQVGSCPACRHRLAEYWVWHDKVPEPDIQAMLAMQAAVSSYRAGLPAPEHDKNCPLRGV